MEISGIVDGNARNKKKEHYGTCRQTNYESKPSN